jgi:hypothetical protein
MKNRVNREKCLKPLERVKGNYARAPQTLKGLTYLLAIDFRL